MIRSALLAILVSASASAQVTPRIPAHVALVTDLSGNAGALAILSEIPANSTVQLEGELAVLYYASGDAYRFRGPARIGFGAAEARVLEGAPAERTAGRQKQIELKPGGIAPATFVMRGGEISPELRARLDAARPAPNAPVSERVAYAAWLEQLGLRDEARRYWQALAAERPGSDPLKVLAR